MQPANDTRLRILLGAFEISRQGRPASQDEISARTGLSNGSLYHHIPRLIDTGLLQKTTGARSLLVTDAGMEVLAQAALIEPCGTAVIYTVTARGYELLEMHVWQNGIAPPSGQGAQS